MNQNTSKHKDYPRHAHRDAKEPCHEHDHHAQMASDFRYRFGIAFDTYSALALVVACVAIMLHAAFGAVLMCERTIMVALNAQLLKKQAKWHWS
ncbi:hypothetical protein FHS56_001322 [Thermonema lapsum]|uniref:Uncharacterized protein n=1 Tax=Thermonema lapsum TaxID=28195 RepID=A0A846MQS4_9BACT|nr:hypothetical protein [Thermonema lapsum]NIK73809.1 hypothetical protein [Thermonema lapsum]